MYKFLQEWFTNLVVLREIQLQSYKMSANSQIRVEAWVDLRLSTAAACGRTDATDARTTPLAWFDQVSAKIERTREGMWGGHEFSRILAVNEKIVGNILIHFLFSMIWHTLTLTLKSLMLAKISKWRLSRTLLRLCRLHWARTKIWRGNDVIDGCGALQSVRLPRVLIPIRKMAFGRNCCPSLIQ